MEREFALKDYIYILFKRKAIFFTFFIALTIIVAAASYILKPSYRAESTLLIERAEEEPLVPVKRAISDFVDRVSLITTQVEFVTSRRVLEQTVKDFSLDKVLPLKGDNRFEKAIIYLKKNVKVLPVKNTDFIKIRLDLDDKSLVAPVVNALADYYIKFYYEIRQTHSSDVVVFIDKQIDLIKNKLEKAEQGLRNYEKNNDIVFVKGEQWIYLDSLVDEQKRLIRLQQDYSNSHPDVVASKIWLKWLKDKVRGFPDKKMELRRLEYVVQKYRDIYYMLLKKKEEMRIAAEMEKGRIGNIRTIQIVDPAIEPIKPYWPKKKMNVLAAVILGIFGGIGLCFWTEYLDHRIYSRDDIKRFYGLSTVGAIRASRRIRAMKKPPAADTFHMYSDLWTNINALWPRGVKTVLITAPSRWEGKTATAYNLSLVLSREKKVLLIDADPTHPQLHRLLAADYKSGVTSLSGTSRPSDTAALTEVQNLWVVPYGGGKDTAVLPDAAVFKSFIERAKREFDYVIIDSPGCATQSMPLLIAPAVDYAIFVVRAGFTRREAAADAIERLKHVRPEGWGIVLNAQRYYVPGFIYKRL